LQIDLEQLRSGGFTVSQQIWACVAAPGKGEIAESIAAA
jgi:hypothetical protein